MDEPKLKTRPKKEFTLKDNVPCCPYKTQNEKWDAIERLINLEHERAEAGWSPIESKEIIQWMDLNRDEIQTEKNKPSFTEFCLARSKKAVGASLARNGPKAAEVLDSLADDVLVMTPKEKKEYLQLYTTLMEKSGFGDIDINKGQVEEEFDTDEAMAEALSLAVWLNKRNLCPQNLVKGLIHGVKQERTSNRGRIKEIGSVVEADEVSEVRSSGGPDKAVEAV